jgi:regulator of sirC expression with transglutaminase-like and TPR domain
MTYASLLVAVASVAASTPTNARAELTPAATGAAIFDRPEARLDYLEATIAFDRLIEKGGDGAATRAMVVRLTDAARQMAGPSPSDRYKLAAVRKAIYGAGAWNYNRPFTYDLKDPFGQQVRSKMLSTYVRTRKGNCVSMPVLFLIVADRIGLEVRLAAAPLHLFVRYTDTAGIDHNLEATSGGHEARSDWYRTNLPMSDRAIQSGIYLRTLSKRETVAQMAASVLDFLMAERRYQEAADVADAMLAVNPRDAYALVKKGSAMGEMLKAEFQDKYPVPALIPQALRPRYAMLARPMIKLFGMPRVSDGSLRGESVCRRAGESRDLGSVWLGGSPRDPGFRRDDVARG